ncbi:MAG: transketolase [Firmicutes bacterium]|nr:transketolase [Bacillota bacterium]
MENRIINNIKSLGIDMIDSAGSGHPGIVLGAAPIIYSIYANHMNINVNDPKWINRDRFVMSAGHGSALLYATLFMAGYDLNIDDLKNFRKINSKTPGHPEYGVTPGVDMSTGPLGQGFASAVGMALGGKILNEKYKLKRKNNFDSERGLIDYKVYVLCGDGDLMEGISYEAASLAGNLNLDNLIVLYDSNNVSLDGDTSNTFTENVVERFKAMGWHTELVKDGTNSEDIDKAIEKAKKAGKPSLIEVKTVIGKDSVWEGTNKVHGKCLEKEDILNLKGKLLMPTEPFYVDMTLVKQFRTSIKERSSIKYELFNRNYNEYVKEYLNDDASSLKYLFADDLKVDLSKYRWEFNTETKEATRVSNGYVLNELTRFIPNLIGGSADLSSSTNTYLKSCGDIKDGHYDGKNIWFGVREHAMGAILNGLALSSFRVFGSTFLVFSDYLKPAIRLSALMNLPVTYIFTHDSINIGQDGPTHQPIEQLASLRAIPNFNVYRPADSKEIVGCYQSILNSKKPSALILSRNEVSMLENTNIENTSKGAYIIRKEVNNLHGIIIATGSEVHTAYHIAYELYEQEGLDLRVISMPSMEIFKEQSDEYKKELLPLGYKTFVIEAGSSFGWHQFVYNDKYLMTVDKFGTSGTKDEVLEHCDFSYSQIKDKIKKLLK